MFDSLKRYWARLDVERDVQDIRDRKRREQRILENLNRIGFSWRVYFVAFLGFLASSWSLIAIGIMGPALYSVYPPEGRVGKDAGLSLDMATLTASVVGMVFFGHLADLWGRSALYGFELLIVLSAIGGAAFSSEGYMDRTLGSTGLNHSMDIYTSLLWWRCALGLGIGAEYTMSAVIAAEFASTASRGTMLAGIFLAQPIGRLLAYGLGLGILRGLVSHPRVELADHPGVSDRLIMDDFWRLILGLAGIPAIFAIGLRWFIPETPRFYSAVKRDMKKAAEAITKVGSKSPKLRADLESMSSDLQESAPQEQVPWGSKARDYFFGRAQGWKPLLAISFQWLMLDVAFYGTGMDSPSTLNSLFMYEAPPAVNTTEIAGFGVWNEDLANPYLNVTQVVDNNLVRVLQLSSIPAIAGSLTVIPLVNYVSRKSHFIWTSVVLTILFAAMAIAVSQTYAQPTHLASVVLYALAQFMFNLGPNTLTFVLAAEVFPTEFRGTCYGIAAASGKIGAIVVRPIIEAVGREKQGLVTMLSVFSGVLFFMAFVAWWEPYEIALPSVQKYRKPRGEGEERSESQGEKGPPQAEEGEVVGEEKDLTFFWEKLVIPLENKSLEDIAPWPIVDPEADEDSSGPDEDGNGSRRSVAREESEPETDVPGDDGVLGSGGMLPGPALS